MSQSVSFIFFIQLFNNTEVLLALAPSPLRVRDLRGTLKLRSPHLPLGTNKSHPLRFSSYHYYVKPRAETPLALLE